MSTRISPGRSAYLFCIARADLLPPSLDLEGLEGGSKVLQDRQRDLAAVLSEVSLDDFTGPQAEARLKDLGWLAPRALRHEQIIEETARHSPVLPARFGTIFSTLSSLEEQISRHHDAIRAFLDRTLGAEEWGLKGYLDRNKAQERAVDEEMAARSSQLSASPGLRYMQERKLRGEADAKVSRWLRETAAELKEQLSRFALEATERRLLAASAVEVPGEMVMNWAFLVPRPGLDAFRAKVEELARAVRSWGLALEVGGPFPPYSFALGLGEPEP